MRGNALTGQARSEADTGESAGACANQVGYRQANKGRPELSLSCLLVERQPSTKLLARKASLNYSTSTVLTMSTDNESTFFKPRYLSDASLQEAHATNAQCEFITFLAVIQKFGIEILPITWQAMRQPIGIGATGRINEALINLHTSFAFKCVADRQKENNSEERIIQAIISEVIVLSHPSIRNHPNIVELQGICWDVVSGDKGNNKVWPVLVFEKSQYGDLYNFAMLPVGRELGFLERLKLCADIGTAISDMHVSSRLPAGPKENASLAANYISDIIHGDVKPENVLVFKDNTGAYTARVTDFGYSTQFANEDDMVSVPKSWPWCAPEHDRNKFKPAQARKMDVFSFGILCLWFLFEKYLSGITPLPREAHWAERYFQGKVITHLSKKVIGELKQEDKLLMLAKQLILAERDLDAKNQQALAQFFDVSITCNPDLRKVDLRELCSSLVSNQ
jgi:serine/threonine protein kinase